MNIILLARLLERQPHRLSPAQLELAVRNYEQIVEWIEGFLNDPGRVDQDEMREIILQLHKKQLSVIEKWNPDRKEILATFQHARSHLKELQPRVTKTHNRLINALFPGSNGKRKVDYDKEPLNPRLIKLMQSLDFEKDNDDTVVQSEADANTQGKSFAEYYFRRLAKLSEDMDFFLRNHYYKEVLPYSPYSYEKSSIEREKEYYQQVEKEVSKLVKSIIRDLRKIKRRGRNYDRILGLARFLRLDQVFSTKESKKQKRKGKKDVAARIRDLRDKIIGWDHPFYREAFDQGGYASMLRKNLKEAARYRADLGNFLSDFSPAKEVEAKTKG